MAKLYEGLSIALGWLILASTVGMVDGPLRFCGHSGHMCEVGLAEVVTRTLQTLELGVEYRFKVGKDWEICTSTIYYQ